MRQPVAFESARARLVGVLGLPGASPCGQGVVLVHGWAGYRIGPHRILVRAARRLNDAGFATLHYDLPGRGDSQGRADDADLDAMIASALDAASFLRAQAGVRRVALLGLCSGANVALGAAALDRAITHVAAWSALPFQRQTAATGQAAARRKASALSYLKKLFRLETWKKAVSGRINYRLVKKAMQGSDAARCAGRNLKDSTRDILEELASCPARILFVHGGKDPEGMAGREHFMDFYQRRRLAADFHLVEGANHSYYSLAWESEIIERTLRFLASS